MNPELPNPMLDALAREAAPAAHPSPDVLTSFVERSLSGDEKQQVTDHLARCAECREIIFLASNASHEPVAEMEEDEHLVAAMGRRASVFAARAPAAEAMTTVQLAEKPQRKWFPRLIWGVPVAATVAVIAGLLVQQRIGPSRPTPQLASNEVRNIPPPQAMPRPMASPPAAVAAPVKPVLAKPTRPDHTKSAPSSTYDAMAVVAEQPEAAEGEAKSELPVHVNSFRGTPAAPLGGPVISPERAVASARALGTPIAGAAGARNGATGQLFAAPQVSNDAAKALHPRWRITAEGQLEQSTPFGWTRALPDKTAIFRVVSVVGNHIWVGGNGGALFHSNDGGQTWSQVALTSSSGGETSDIVSIRFDDPQNGMVIAESGSRYLTADGGSTWSRQ
jgi:hypothetical protein